MALTYIDSMDKVVSSHFIGEARENCPEIHPTRRNVKSASSNSADGTNAHFYSGAMGRIPSLWEVTNAQKQELVNMF